MRALLEAISLDCPFMGLVGPQDGLALELLGKQICKVTELAHPDHCLKLPALATYSLFLLVGDEQWGRPTLRSETQTTLVENL